MKRCNCVIGWDESGEVRKEILCHGDGTEYRGVVKRASQELVYEAYVCKTHADMHFLPTRWSDDLQIITVPLFAGSEEVGDAK